MPETPLQKARKLSAELGSPGVQALWTAVQKAGLQVTREQVKDLVASQGQKQIFGKLQPAEGKTASRGDDWQMDLADLKNSPGTKTKKAQDRVYKFFLVVVNVFDRFVYTRALKTKEPWEVKTKLSQIISEAPAKPKVISSDNGNEFLGEVSAYLQGRGIAQRFKAVGDMNALGVVDRAIQSIKQIIARMMVTSDGESWVDVLPRATKAYNETPKGPLHGSAPSEVRGNPQVTFMLLQDNAQKAAHNERLKDKRVAALQDAGAFRAPLPEATSKFRRSFQPTYGDLKEVRSVKGSTVTAQDGTKVDVKRIKIVPAESSTAQGRFGQNTAGPERKRQAAGAIIVQLQELLDGREQLSLTKASELLRERMRSEVENYDQVLRKAKAKLIDVIRLAPEIFVLTVTPRSGGKDWYYVALRT